MLLTLILTALSLFLFTSLYRLFTNYRIARQIGLPIIICPATWQNPLWLLLITSFSSIRNLSFIPGLQWIRYSYLGWVLFDTYHTHHTHGPAFTLVSTAGNEIIIGDPKLINEVMSRHKKWLKPRELYSAFSVLGENVNSVNAEEWQKHRRVINAGFVEGNMKIVWNCATKQARQWISEQTINLEQLHQDTNTISNNTLMRAGFGKDYNFSDAGLKDVKPGFSKSLATAMQYMGNHFLFAWGAKDLQLPKIIEPKKIKELRETLVETKSYLGDIIRDRSGEFVEALIEANESEKTKTNGKGHLTHDELYGNLFMLQLAGFDTTRYALFYTLALLSAHTDIQDWVREEIVSASDPDLYPDDLHSYETTYPNSTRIRAAMMETLRLFTAAPSLPRYSTTTEPLTISNKSYIIPAKTIVSSNFPAIHTDPHIWGDDANTWNPKRWVLVRDGREVLAEHHEMMAWAAGPRICPGKKFSQVETVAVLIEVLRGYRVEGTGNMDSVLRDFDFELTPKPNRPMDAEIKFVKI